MYLGKAKKILEIVEELKGERFNQIREDMELSEYEMVSDDQEMEM